MHGVGDSLPPPVPGAANRSHNATLPHARAERKSRRGSPTARQRQQPPPHPPPPPLPPSSSLPASRQGGGPHRVAPVARAQARQPSPASSSSDGRRKAKRKRTPAGAERAVGIKCVNCAPGCPNLGSRRHHHVSGMCGRCHQRWIKRPQERWAIHHCFSKCRCQRCQTSRDANLLVGVTSAAEVPTAAAACEVLGNDSNNRSSSPASAAGSQHPAGQTLAAAPAAAAAATGRGGAPAEPWWVQQTRAVLLRSFDGLRGASVVTAGDFDAGGDQPHLEAAATGILAIAGDSSLRSDVRNMLPFRAPAGQLGEASAGSSRSTSTAGAAPAVTTDRCVPVPQPHHRGLEQEGSADSAPPCEGPSRAPAATFAPALLPHELVLCLAPSTSAAAVGRGVNFPLHVSSMNAAARRLFNCTQLSVREQSALLPLARLLPSLEDLAKVWALYLRLQLTDRPQRTSLVLTHGSTRPQLAAVDCSMTLLSAAEARPYQAFLPGCHFVKLGLGVPVPLLHAPQPQPSDASP